MKKIIKTNIPTIIVALGATGDLMHKKILPSLYHLKQKNLLPDRFKVVGVARKKMDNNKFRLYLENVLAQHKDIKYNKSLFNLFKESFGYVSGSFENIATFKDIKRELDDIDKQWGTCSNKLFYLAVPPNMYETIFRQIKKTSLATQCGLNEGWTRVIVEKPFGSDAKRAKQLDSLLGSLFKEEQIYRIDHYLAKLMMYNIFSFRFSNNLMEESWNNKHIEKIEIRILEKAGLEKRGAFYDGVGALRDVGANHLLQMLAFVTMDKPKRFDVASLHEQRYRLLSALPKMNAVQIKQNTYRAQYQGYKKINGVSSCSQTETYFKIKTELFSDRWSGVPIYLEAGKNMPQDKKEVIVTFKHPKSCYLCAVKGVKKHQDRVVFSLSPKESISVDFWTNIPGLDLNLGKQTCNVSARINKKIPSVEEYERLILQCIAGDQTMFVTTNEVKEMWRFIDPIKKVWDANSVLLENYKPQSDKILNIKFVEQKNKTMPKEIVVIGLGKMGAGIALQLADKGWRVVGNDRSQDAVDLYVKQGILGAYTIQDAVKKLNKKKVVWIMVPSGKPVDSVLFGKTGLIKYLSKGDIIIDGGNSFYKDTITRAKKLKKYGIKYIDAGVSGGPYGARNGACIMTGGDKKTFEYLKPLYLDLVVEQGIQHFEGIGAGHFVKMIHNGIEYGMMQAIAEGFTLLKENPYFKLDLTRVSEIYNHGSVIESRLIGWLKNAFEQYSEELKSISCVVGHLGEGDWTVREAKALKIRAKVIEEALKYRIDSEKGLCLYTGKVVSALRNQFGGHLVKDKK